MCVTSSLFQDKPPVKIQNIIYLQLLEYAHEQNENHMLTMLVSLVKPMSMF